MRILKLILALIVIAILNIQLLTLNCSAATTIPGGYISGHWTLAGSPYNITGTVNIKSDSTLIIDPGVIVNFQTSLKLKMLVNGRILAIGTASQNIYFTATDYTNGFGGIRYNTLNASNDTSKFIYCNIQFGMDGASPYNNGGALYFNNWNKAIISHCTIKNCKSNYGNGAIYCNNSIPIITYNTFSNNYAGAIYLENTTNAIIANNIISYNSAPAVGGGIGCENCSNVWIINNTISNNSAQNGGGIFCGSDTNDSISHNIISNNSATYYGGGGGGVYFYKSTIKSISYNIISGNLSAGSGGGIYCNSNCIINSINNTCITNNSTNLAYGNGGGIYLDGNYGNNISTITNVTIANNKAFSGGGVYGTDVCNPIFRNCIFWGNTDNYGSQVFLVDEPSDPSFYYCDVQDGLAGIIPNGNFYSGTYSNNINALPKFVAPSAGSGSATYQGTYNWTLQLASPCRNTGDPGGTYPATDLANNARVSASIIDMGAYEYQMGITFTKTSVSCKGGNNGTATANVINGNPDYTYLWSANAGSQTTQTATELAAGIYSVTVTDASTATATASVTIIQPEVISVQTSTTNAVCINANGSASITASGGTAPYSYLWSTTATDSTIIGLIRGTYSYTVTDKNNCTASGSVIVIADNDIPPQTPSICIVTVDTSSSKNLIIWEKPVATAMDSFKIYREISSVYTTIATISYSEPSIYTDKTSGVNPNTTAYKYKISVIDSCGNESVLSDYHRTIHVAISPGSPCGYNLIWNDYIGFPVTQYLIYRDSSNTGWVKKDSVSFGNTSWTDFTCYPSHDTISYLVEAVNPAGCNPTNLKGASSSSSRSNVQRNYAVINSISVRPSGNDLNFKISPNPTNGKFTIQMGDIKLSTANYQLSIITAQGEVIYKSEIADPKPEIDLSHQPSGIYIVIIKSGEKIYHQKLIKE